MAVGEIDSICSHKNTSNITEDEIKDLLWSPSDKLVITMVIPIVAFIGIIANGIFLYTVARIPSMRTLSNCFLSSLAVIDINLLLGILIHYASLYATSELKRNYQVFQSSVGCFCLFFYAYTFGYGEMFNVTLVALEQYFAVCHPLKNRINQRRNFKVLAVTGLLAAILAGGLQAMSISKMQVSCLLWPNNNGKLQLQVYTKCIRVSQEWGIIASAYPPLLYITLLVVNLVAYCKIIKKIKNRHVNENHSRITSRPGQVRMRNQIATMLAIHAVVFFLCYFFNRFADVVRFLSYFGIDFLSRVQVDSLHTISRATFILNSAINPFIYGVSSQQYRKAFFKAFRSASGSCKISKTTDRNTENPKKDTNWRFKSEDSSMTSVL